MLLLFITLIDFGREKRERRKKETREASDNYRKRERKEEILCLDRKKKNYKKGWG